MMHEHGRQFEAAASLYERIGRFEDASRCLRLAGRVEEAEQVLAKSAYRGAESVGATATSSDLMRVGEGVLARARGGERAAYAQAIQIFQRVPADAPEYVRARTLAAQALAEIDDHQNAMALLGQLLRGLTIPSKDHVPALYHYGLELERSGYLAEARQAFRAVASLDPSFMDLNTRMPLLGSTNTFETPFNPEELAARRARILGQPGASPRTPTPIAASIGAASVIPTPGRPPTPAGPAPLSVSAQVSIVRGEVLSPARPDDAQRIGPPAASATPSDRWDDKAASRSILGLVLRGRFRIEGEIGTGAQARVYLARDVVLDRPVAIKVLSEIVAAEKSGLERFLAEARLLARIRHPGCIGVYDFGQERGLTFMAMEYFEGDTLSNHLKLKGALDVPTALRVTRDVASALSAVHAEGIVHRDVKPSNVLVDASLRVRLADFGVAMNLRGDRAAEAGVMVGTMAYMAPEQARGAQADHRADLFSLGAVMFEMLAGKAPFEADFTALIRRIDAAPPPLPAELPIPQSVRGLVATCLAPVPSQRPESMSALLREIDARAAELGVVSGRRDTLDLIIDSDGF
jgi:tRNA A-37 threonylcarbamoyl transferase component Bud32